MEDITMSKQGYFETFPTVIATSCENFVPMKILAGLWNAPVVGIVRLWNLMMVWQHRADMRRQLGSLDCTHLTDMGIAPANARSEAAKPFWQA